ncbi:hypothetical protein RHSIM_Rhsim10G0205100 [Rhododendron simsii]|uniref:Protein kinase domain-containing protein n=1 Tax=Rhododendron simsii TaxID=118357 RepID=A0A834L9J0_RHOSS|nr:hypothetical protein RHSIM_Rhsim10G0205100 [Rhododendron simsii]
MKDAFHDNGDGDDEGEGGEKGYRILSSNLQEFEEEEMTIATEMREDMVDKQMGKMRDLREILKDRMEKQIREMKDTTEKHRREAIIEIIERDMRETDLIKDQMKEKREMRKKRMRETRERLIREKSTREKLLFELLTLWELWDEEEEMRELRETRSVWRMDIKEIVGIWMREMELRDMRKKRKMREMEKLKYPCLLGRGTEGEGPVLYLFNLDDDERNKEEDEDARMRVLTPASMLRPEYYYTSVVVATVVYVLGGVCQDVVFHNKVFFFDTNYPEKGWIKGPDMLNDRCKGKAVAVEGKIYVFGGNNKTERDSRPWAELLDPITNKWEPLPAPPEGSRIHTRDLLYTPVVYGGPGEGKKIFLSWCHHIYHVDAQTWERFHRPERLYPFSHNLTSNGNILYWTTDALFFSFNMKTKDIDCGLVEGYMLSKYREELLIPEPTLLHLGGDHFCFITLKDLPGGRTKVRCTKFRVSHQGGLKGSVVCCETYIIGHPLDMDYSYAFAFSSVKILFFSGQVVKVADFGVARVQTPPGVMTAETGTYRWMAPEVIEHKPYDHKSVVFSFGVVLWELLTGEVPYLYLTPLQAAFGVVQQGLRPTIPKNTNPKLVELLERCWQQNSILRPDFSEIIEML